MRRKIDLSFREYNFSIVNLKNNIDLSISNEIVCYLLKSLITSISRLNVILTMLKLEYFIKLINSNIKIAHIIDISNLPRISLISTQFLLSTIFSANHSYSHCDLGQGVVDAMLKASVRARKQEMYSECTI